MLILKISDTSLECRRTEAEKAAERDFLSKIGLGTKMQYHNDIKANRLIVRGRNKS